MPDLGFVGLGTMGQSMASRLLSRYGKIAVYDVRKDQVELLAGAGATACSSPSEVASAADLVFVSLPSPEALEEVVCAADGLLSGSRMRCLVDFSTTGPVMARKVADVLSAAGKSFLDAPVSGGPSGARDGTLTIMAAGPEALVSELAEPLGVIGSNVMRVGGEAGQGQLAKVINNLLGATSIAVVGEVLALGMKGGLDPALLLDVINASTGRNSASQGIYPNHVLTRSFNLGFRLRLEAKDVALCLQEAQRAKVPMIVGSAVGQIWAIANARASEEDDFSSIAKMIEEWSGVTLERSPE